MREPPGGAGCRLVDELMKNIVLLLFALATLTLGFMVVRANVRVPLGDKGKTAKVVVGDLTLPINAAGEVRPGRRAVIKSEASGEVLEIATESGARVKEGDLIIRLDPEEESRSVDRAEREVDIAKSALAEARINHNLAKTADLSASQARVDQILAQLENTEYNKNKIENLPDDQKGPDEVIEWRSTYHVQQAQLTAARADLARAQMMIDRTALLIDQAEARLQSAQNTLADARRRLNETKIVTKIDGILSKVRVQVGEVVQGGKTTFTGGTELAAVLDDSRIVVQAEVDESAIADVLKIAPEWAKPGHDDSSPTPDDFGAEAERLRKADVPLPQIYVEAFRDEVFEGVIERIYPEPKIVNNIVTYQVDVVVVSENKVKLLPQMQADVVFTSEHLENVLLCPNEAIREGADGGLGVYVPADDTLGPDAEPEFVACKVGLTDGTMSQVVEGLERGLTVYTKMPRIIKKKDK